ncbi:hypothetical protein M5689_018654 [Euphorbia peplus]|nr:hypothetical protein M5689_018654 [Euphorbia peplus]
MAGQKFCGCGEETVIKVSWKPTNPGIRFYGCPNFGSPYYCGYFLWFDYPVDEHNMNIISGLLRRVRANDGANRMNRVKMLACFVIGLVIGFCYGS